MFIMLKKSSVTSVFLTKELPEIRDQVGLSAYSMDNWGHLSGHVYSTKKETHTHTEKKNRKGVASLRSFVLKFQVT